MKCRQNEYPYYFCSECYSDTPALAVAYVADNLLDEADDGTPDGRIPNSHGGSHKRVAVGAGEKVGDVSRRRSLGALPHGRGEPTTPHGSTPRAGAVTNTISRLNPTRKRSATLPISVTPSPPVFAPRRARYHDALRTPLFQIRDIRPPPAWRKRRLARSLTAMRSLTGNSDRTSRFEF